MLLLGLFSCIAMGQVPCTTSTKLFCEFPVASRAASPNTIGNAAAGFSASFGTQLSQMPLMTSGSGIVFDLNRNLGIYVASDNLGPILAERARTVGKHRLLFGFAYQRFSFNSIDGTGLGNIPFVFRACTSAPNLQTSCPPNTPTIYVQQTDSVSLKMDQYVGLVTYGINDKTDISVIVPIERVSMSTNAVGNQYFVQNNTTATTNPVPFSQFVPGAASGIGDLLINLKRAFVRGEKITFSAGMLVRFPTGDARNYLGSGAYGFNPYGVLSYQARVSPHVRLGYQFNTSTVLNPNLSTSAKQGLPGGFQYDFGADSVVFKKFPTTVAADLLGYYVLNSPVLSPSSITIPGYNITAATLIPQTQSYNSAQFSVGLKIKVVKTLLLYGNAIFPLNNAGLRSSPVPLVGASYTF
jgi:hypothetical protein